MLDSITWEQFKEWQEYAVIEPFGEERADARSATICAILANVNRDTKKRPRPYSTADFMPRYGEAPPKKLTANERWAATKRAVRNNG